MGALEIEFMDDYILHIYYRKKYLRRALVLYSFGFCVWLGIYFIILFQNILNRHPDVGETTHFILSVVLTFVFTAWSVKFIRILVECIAEYRNSPNIAYSLSNEGISSSKKGCFLSWQEVYDASTIVQNEGFYLRKSKKIVFAINSWGIDPEEMKQAKDFILRKLPVTKTKRLK